MNKIKIIKTAKEYETALARLDALMEAVPGSVQEDELELLALLVEKYEAEHFPIDAPDPVQAILFRMDQQGLTTRDMIQYLGSQSKVSEVLNYKRPLSLNMIRSLHEGLGIPLEVLVQRPQPTGPGAPFQALDIFQAGPLSNHMPAEPFQEHLLQWKDKTLARARKEHLPPFEWACLNKKLFKELAALSSYSAGPQMAGELLNRCGIHFIVQKITVEVDLDGACFLTPANRPVISLTLRSDHLEFFWFTLFHLLAHLYLLQDEKPAAYFSSAGCIYDRAAPAEEKRVNAWLRDTLAPPGAVKARIRACLASGDTGSLKEIVQSADTSPEIIACWLRLENEEAAAGVLPERPRKISEKLEVYG